MTIADPTCRSFSTLANGEHDTDPHTGRCLACGWQFHPDMNTKANRLSHNLQTRLPIYLRPHEVLLWAGAPIVHPKNGMPVICAVHGQLRNGMFCWDHRITSDFHRPGTFRIGEDRFSCLRPASGAEPCGGQMSTVFRGALIDGEFDREGRREGEPYYRHGTACFPVPMCPGCGAYCTVKVTQEAYGDRHTCRRCDWEAWYSIGD